MKEDRIIIRANHQEKERISEAAFIAGMSVSSFLRQAALKQSNEILKRRDTITLSERDRDIFLDALENPPPPNQKLLEAFEAYEKIKKVSKKRKSKRKK